MNLLLEPTSPTILQTAEQHRFVNRDSLTLDERLFKMTQRLNPVNWFHVSRFQILFFFRETVLQSTCDADVVAESALVAVLRRLAHPPIPE